MAAHTNANHTTRDEVDDLRALMWANADAGTSSRELLIAHDAVRQEPFYDQGKVFDMARRRTAAAAKGTGRRARGEGAAMKSRQSEGETLLAARTKDLVTQLRPWIDSLRLSLFEAVEPPCRSLEDAARWIEQEARKHPRVEDSPELDALDDELHALFNRLLDADSWIHRCGLSVKENALSYWKPDGTEGKVVVSTANRRLYGVCRAAKRIATLTVLPAATVVAWILAGVLPSQRVRLPNGRTAAVPGLQLVTWRIHYPQDPGVMNRPPVTRTQRAIFDLDVRDLTDRNLRVARREVTKFLDRGAPTLTAKQRRVVEAVERSGGRPTPKFARPFWNRVAKKLKLDDPIAVAQIYYRAQDTLRGKK